jgi:hypothetical protein
MSTTLTPFRMEAGRTRTTSVVTLGDFFGEVVPVLFQPVAGVQVGFIGVL